MSKTRRADDRGAPVVEGVDMESSGSSRGVSRLEAAVGEAVKHGEAGMHGEAVEHGDAAGGSSGAGGLRADWVAQDASLKVSLSSQHFLDGISKVELARRHGLSRFQVARLLDEAREEGIVRIEIVDPVAAGHDLAPLARRLGVSSVTVAAARPGEGRRAAIARQVARLLTTHLPEGGRLGVAWSRTLMHLPDSLGQLSRADVVQLVGSLSTSGYSTAQSSALAHSLGAHTRGQVWALPTPLIVDSAQVAASLRAMEEVRSTLDAADSLDVATVSIGAWAEGDSTLWARLRPEEQQQAREEGVVAEICGILLGADGAVWHSAMEDRVIGVRPDQLRRTRVIAAAPAAGRPDAVVAAARSGLVDDIVLGPELAEQVAALFE